MKPQQGEVISVPCKGIDPLKTVKLQQGGATSLL